MRSLPWGPRVQFLESWSSPAFRTTGRESLLKLPEWKVELQCQNSPHGAVKSGCLKVEGKMCKGGCLDCYFPLQIDVWQDTSPALIKQLPDGTEVFWLNAIT